MAERDALVRGYAQALLSVADAEGVLERVEGELFSFARALESEASLREALTDPGLPVERKRALLEEVLGERADPHTIRLLAFVVEQGRARELGRIVDGLLAAAAERRRHVVAEVRTAVPLTDEQRERLATSLSQATGRAVEVRALVDPSVVGGIVARIGDEVIDGSVAARLREARERLGSA